jgi:hypothetical protein
MGYLESPFGLPYRQSRALRRRRNSTRHGEHLCAPVLVVTFEECSNALRVLGGTGRRGKDPEPGRQHVLPVHSDLP